MKRWHLVICLAAGTALGAAGLWMKGSLAADSRPAAASPGSLPPVVIYTKDNAPATPKLEDLPLKDRLSEYGITWTLAQPARVGQFVNGDWYVVGPVTVVGIDPAPLFGEDCPNVDDPEKRAFKGRYCRNGSVLNIPPDSHHCGFDSRIRHEIFDPNRPARLPIAMKPGDSLVSTLSKGAMERTQHFSPVAAVAILTCLKAPVPADAFRPGYMDRQQKIYLARDLNRALLPALQRVPGTPAIGPLVEHFWPPWMDVCLFNEDHAPYQWHGYGQRPTFYLSQALLALCLDFTPRQKEPLLLCTVQRGIDLWGICRSGHPGWVAWGGWNSGRKAPIVLAGMLLGDPEMASPGKTCPRVSFQEDEQTMYGQCWTGAGVVFTGHSGVSVRPEEDRQKERRHQWGPYEHLPPAQWTADNDTSEAYRRCCTSRTWPGEALAMRLLHAEKDWDHEAFFDYVDRWMYEDQTPRLAEQVQARGGKEIPAWARQGQCEDPFVAAMWAKYRRTLAAPIDGWKKQKANPPPAPIPPGAGRSSAP